MALLDSVAFTQARVAIQNILGKPTLLNMHFIPLEQSHPLGQCISAFCT
jgi:hypothetical protein